jgi:NTE family protein
MPRVVSLPIFAALLLLGGCATRPINPPITQTDPNTGYRYQVRQQHSKDQENLVILAFSGGGTRAAAFSYGVLEFLRRTEIVGPKGNRGRLLDEVDVITGVSGGSFTALAYGLYGEKLFKDYEQNFLKRNVERELVSRLLSPINWAALNSPNWGRSELAAQFYDEILFHGATFGDLDRGDGPMILASATDISSGARFVFNQALFDVLCSDLDAVPLSRAAAASSAVPVVLSSVTISNYGGTCNTDVPPWVKLFLESAHPPRPAARAIRELKEAAAYGDSVHRPYIHLVDGGISDNLGMRGVLDALQLLESLHGIGVPTPIDRARRIIVFVVNSLSSPPTNWDESETSPGTVDILLKASGVPIDHYSFEAVELLKDTAARWQDLRRIRNSAAFASNTDPAIAQALRTPDAEVYAIDVSFGELKDKAEREYLNEQPTSFALPAEAVDRLRAAAGTIILASPEFQRLLRDVGAKIVTGPPASGPARIPTTSPAAP